MKIWVLFLFGSLLAGAMSMRPSRIDRPPRRALMLVACVFVAAAYYSGRLSGG